MRPVTGRVSSGGIPVSLEVGQTRRPAGFPDTALADWKNLAKLGCNPNRPGLCFFQGQAVLINYPKTSWSVPPVLFSLLRRISRLFQVRPNRRLCFIGTRFDRIQTSKLSHDLLTSTPRDSSCVTGWFVRFVARYALRPLRGHPDYGSPVKILAEGSEFAGTGEVARRENCVNPSGRGFGRMRPGGSPSDGAYRVVGSLWALVELRK